MELSYILLVCGFTYLSLSDVYCTYGGGYEFLPCSDPDILSSSRCLLLEAEVDKECNCQSLCDNDDRCVCVFYNPDTKTCRLYDHNKEEIETTGLECAILVDCGVPDFGDGVDANFNTTTLGSVAEIECALGYFSTTDDIQSVCQGSGQWSNPTGLCEEIPRLRGIKELWEYDAGLECRNVISEPVQANNGGVYAICADDEIMTGCSTTNGSGTWQMGAGIWNSQCFTESHVGTRAVARCCKLPGLRCEYIRNVGLTESVSCYKNFHLLDCVCRRSGGTSTGPCPILMIDNNCVNPYEYAGLAVFRYAVCCDLGDYSCYRKNMTGLDTDDSDLLRIRCDDAGEVMTSCSGYSYAYHLFGSLIKSVEGADECQLDPGPGDISQLYGYTTCCKRKQ